MIRWGEHSEKGVMVRRTDGRTDGMNLFTELLVVAAKKCQVKSGHSCGHQTFVLLCSLSFMISRRSRVGLFDFRALYRILLTTFQMCFIRLPSGNGLWFNIICEFNYIHMILYITPWYLQRFANSNDHPIRDVANNIKRWKQAYCKLIFILAVSLWLSWDLTVYIDHLWCITLAGWYAHDLCWLQWAQRIHKRWQWPLVEILGVWDASLLCKSRK